MKRSDPRTIRALLLPPLTLICALMLVLVSAPAHAEKPAEPAPTASLDTLLEESGLSLPESCLDLSTPKALAARRAAWSKAIASLYERAPDQLHDWLVGRVAPPKLAMDEAILQRDCMIGALITAAAEPESPLMLDFGSEYAASKRTMREMARKYEKGGAQQRRIARHFDQSHHRDAAGQSFIWYRKFTFTHPRSFNLISAHAAEKCGLTAGHSWKPTSSSHKRCWMDHLTPEERQREILTASSAPGISRHHWGSEFDLYGLNPRRFQERADLHDEYVWMRDHALEHGFFQPFLGNEALGEDTYIEERWHWSYYPLAQALVDYIEQHPDRFEAALDALWKGYDERWSGKKNTTSHFSYVRAHWRSYVLHTARLKLAELPPWMSPSSLLRLARG